jgi:hypothetical protein
MNRDLIGQFEISGNQDGEHNSYTGSLNLSLDNYKIIAKWIISGDQIQEGSGF